MHAHTAVPTLSLHPGQNKQLGAFSPCCLESSHYFLGLAESGDDYVLCTSFLTAPSCPDWLVCCGARVEDRYWKKVHSPQTRPSLLKVTQVVATVLLLWPSLHLQRLFCACSIEWLFVLFTILNTVHFSYNAGPYNAAALVTLWVQW